MPIKLTAAQTQQITVDSVEITAFAIDLSRREIHVSYKEGTLDSNNVFTPVSGEKLATISGADFLAAIQRGDVIANGMPAGSVSVYGALKGTLYEYLQTLTGLTGTII